MAQKPEIQPHNNVRKGVQKPQRVSDRGFEQKAAGV
jgi:hypothetical protein